MPLGHLGCFVYGSQLPVFLLRLVPFGHLGFLEEVEDDDDEDFDFDFDFVEDLDFIFISKKFCFC